MLQFREVGGGERFLPPPCRLVCRMCEEAERVKERSKRGDRQLPLFLKKKDNTLSTILSSFPAPQKNKAPVSRSRVFLSETMRRGRREKRK